MIVLDASILIAHLSARDDHHERAVRLLGQTEGEGLAASPISLAETLVEPAQKGKLGEVRDALERLGIVELSFGADAHVRLAELRAQTGRKLPDCCVLLAAKEIGATVASFDAPLIRAAEKLNLHTVS